MSHICHELHVLFSGLPRMAFPFDAGKIPRSGVYILFEKGERAHEGDRIVRIGTHTGDNQLPSRLRQHFIKENKDRSIFRKNIGRVILNKNGDSFLKDWEIDLTTSKAKAQYTEKIDLQKLQEVERRVTEYIQLNFSFVFFKVDDKENRLHWESKIISTVSGCNECFRSKTWLGLFSTKEKIKESGLWQVNELYKQPLSESDYQTLRKEVFGSSVRSD